MPLDMHTRGIESSFTLDPNQSFLNSTSGQQQIHPRLAMANSPGLLTGIPYNQPSQSSGWMSHNASVSLHQLQTGMWNPPSSLSVSQSQMASSTHSLQRGPLSAPILPSASLHPVDIRERAAISAPPSAQGTAFDISVRRGHIVYGTEAKQYTSKQPRKLQF